MVKQLLLVFVGGGFGSVLRFIIGKFLNNTENGIPYGTFAANIIGSLLIGIILGMAAKNDTLTSNQTLLLATGFCGGFTTFSAVTAHALEPIEGGMLFLAQNILFSLIAVIVVLPLARKVIPVRR